MKPISLQILQFTLFLEVQLGYEVKPELKYRYFLKDLKTVIFEGYHLDFNNSTADFKNV